MTFPITTIAALLVIMVALAGSASAQSQLNELALEELMRLDAGQVFGASERLQPSIEAPASVSFITAEEIKRYGYRTLAEILSAVRGMYVVNDRNYSYLGARGFSVPGDYNTRVLLLVNGHRVNDNLFGQAEVGAEFGLDPAMFERVEIIRGPASSLYGDSAFFVVVNVITRTGASLGGGSIDVEAGTLGTRLVRGAIGQRFKNGMQVALSGTYAHADGVGRLYFPAFDTPATNNGVAEGLDGEGVKQFYGRLDFGNLTVTSAYGSRRREVPTASSNTVFNEQENIAQTFDRHTLLDADYGRSFGATRVTVRASFDRFTYDSTNPSAGEPEGAPTVVGVTSGVGMRWSVGSGVTRSFNARHTLRAGIEFIDNVNQNQLGRYVDPPAVVFDNRRSSEQHAIYAQDEIRLARWLIVNAGLRYDGYQTFHRVTPRAALIVLPSSMQSVKYLYGSAFRSPNAYESNSDFFGEGVNDLRPESIDTHELVWERYLNDWVRTSVSAYWYKAERLIAQVPDDSALLGVTFVNQGSVRAKGLELEAQVRLRGEARALASYALQDAVEQGSLAGLPNSPRHMAKGRISLPGPINRSLVSVEGQYLSSRGTLDGLEVGAAATVNVTVIQPLGRSWELSGSVRNIFDARYLDPVSNLHRQDAIVQNGRTARIGLRWKLWTN
jgi:outer membrane receptor for ferrienterochelin and colicins